jgi:hypothetical protein
MSGDPQSTDPNHEPGLEIIPSGPRLRLATHAEVERLRKALREVDRLCPEPGGAGQVARDALRIGA